MKDCFMENRCYLGVKLIEGCPMSLGEYNTYREWQIPEREDPEREGYWVRHKDGYESWSPKEIFEKHYFPMGWDNDSRITREMVDSFMGHVTGQVLDEKTTMVKAKTLTGFVEYEVSSCVDPKNYDHDLGVDIAAGRIRDTLWKCLGFVLQWGRYGLKR